MAEHEAKLVKNAVGSLTTDDRQHMLLKLEMADGTETVLAFPQDQLGPLTELAALGLTRGEGAETALGKAAFKVVWWELGVEAQTKQFLLSLSLGSGAILRFLLADQMPEQILETLGTMLGKSTPQKPGTPLN